MAISRRESGHLVDCPKCGSQITVPFEDIPTRKGEPSTSVKPDEDENEPETHAGLGAAFEDLHDDTPDPELDVASAGEGLHDPSETPSATTESEPFVPDEIGGDDEGDGPLTFHRKNIVADDMDLTPMVDVTFQLLIFFMVSASFSLQKSIEVPTPDPDQKGATQQVKTLEDLQGTSILVKIDASNGIWIDDEPLSDISRLADTLRDKMRREQKTELLVTASSQSMHRTVIAVIDAANEIGVQKIRMSSQKKSE